MKVSDNARAEAAFWLTGLHGPERDAALERGFKRWLNESAEHRAAFELLTETWELSGRLPAGSFPQAAAPAAANESRSLLPFGIAACLVALIAFVGLKIIPNEHGLSTRVGEQRILTLDDGSRVFLNTATQIVADYDERTRRVMLRKGEALFEVAKESARPFVVVADETEITALGTSFVVRQDANQLAVTLMEGKVRVVAPSVAEPVMLIPGQRVMVSKRAAPALDTPSIKKITAWRTGLLDLDDTPLHQAVNEMNRYSLKQLKVTSRNAERLPVSGLFRVGDSLNFARAVAATYRMEVSEGTDEIVLAGEPVLPVPSGVHN